MSLTLCTIYYFGGTFWGFNSRLSLGVIPFVIYMYIAVCMGWSVYKHAYMHTKRNVNLPQNLCRIRKSSNKILKIGAC